MKLTLGIDIGTYGSKAVLADAAGRIVAQAERAHEMIVPRPGWAEHRADADWWDDFCALSRQVIGDSGADTGAIACVAASAIGPCMLPVDAAGRPLMNAVLYGVDTRASAEVAELTETLGAGLLVARCGNALTSQSVGPKILWLRRNRPEIFAATAHVLTSTSYLVLKLTGEIVIDHYTAANFGPLYDVARQDWAPDLAVGIIEPSRLPRVMWSTGIAGRVSAEAARATGLAEGTPVTAGTIDAAAEAVSVGVARPGDMMLMYGSTIFMILLTDGPRPDPRLWYAPWLYPGQHASMAGLATSGTLTHWFRDRFALDLPHDAAFRLLAAEAEASPPGANGLLFLPYFSGERTPIHDPDAKGVIFGLNLTHGRGDLYRAMLEGIAYGTRHVTDTFAEAGASPARLLAVGGGVQNPLWLQTTSDVTGLDQIVCTKTLGASYGDAFLAAAAAGLNPRIAEWNPEARRITAHHLPVHDRHYALFRKLYHQTREIARALSDDPA